MTMTARIAIWASLGVVTAAMLTGTSNAAEINVIGSQSPTS
jgi:hypothetical protein